MCLNIIPTIMVPVIFSVPCLLTTTWVRDKLIFTTKPTVLEYIYKIVYERKWKQRRNKNNLIKRLENIHMKHSISQTFVVFYWKEGVFLFFFLGFDIYSNSSASGQTESEMSASW